MLAWTGEVAARDDRDFPAARAMFVERLAIMRQLGSPRGIAAALNGLAGLMSDPQAAGAECDPSGARALAEESLAIMRGMGDRQGMAHSLFLLGRLARQAGDIAEHGRDAGGDSPRQRETGARRRGSSG